ncbi:hypothetical protein [Anaerocellum diazotrophicum]|uniref:Uncharacterized protein n=1 Tax=Caldicellulosiruptor diazotrophicus TaxID=2806205 RepID=A0ABM7NLC1_9FIRM|nr:hypothetical protein [Caldicellulosiruptor diazotrophicus]BCS80914.1 hypothetical protein CaldiYA01_08740 [Caldicellulosiruptor diazotrophicus]
MLIIEVKKVNSSHVLEIEKDIHKLKQYTKQTISSKNNKIIFATNMGVLGFYIGDNAKEEPLIKRFKNGKELAVK